MTASSLDLNCEQQLQNFLTFPEFCSYFTFKTEVGNKTHIDWHNLVTSVRLFPLGPVSDQKREGNRSLF